MGWRTVVRVGVLFGVIGLLPGSAGEPVHFVPASAADAAAVSAQESGPATPTRAVTLVPGWNLVGWTGNTAVVDATLSITGAFDALFTYDAAAQRFRTFNPTGLAFLNTLEELDAGDGVWILANRATTWTQPDAVTGARSVALLPGFNLEMWTGPDGTDAAAAFAPLGDALRAAFSWDAASQQFRSYAPGRPTFLNDLTVLEHGTGIWLQMYDDSRWPQPAKTLASLASSIVPRPQVIASGGIPALSNLPDVTLMTVSAPDEEFIVTVRGAAGAAPSATSVPGQLVDYLRISAADWATEVCVPVSLDGSFSASLPAGPGTTLYIQAVAKFRCDLRLGSTVATLRVPEGVDHTDPMRPFAVSGVAGDWHWIGSGLLLGADAHIEFQFPDGGPTSCVTPRLHVFRLFDEGGDYAGQPNVNIHGPPLTPTGLPIETNVGADGFWQLVEPAYAGPGQAPDCLASGQRYDLAGWTAALAPGWYRPRVAFYEVLPDGTAEYNAGLDKGASTDASLLIETNTGLGYLPLAPVGAPMPPRIPLTLFNDSVGWASNGSRGAVAIEDADIFALGSRRVAQAPFVASRYDPLSGRALTYSLEPFAPTLGYTGFAEAVPQLPTLPLNEAAFGTLSISLTSPNGVEVDLAVEAAVEAICVSGWTRNAPQAELSFAGPGSTFQLYTRRESLEIRFEQYGQYRATVTGALQTIWGDEIQIAGHYDFWVAEPLDLSLGTFEGTPLEVGDVLSPVVVVEPGVPADIEIVVDHFVDGDVDQHEQFRIVGTANALGYFAAASGWTPGSHGEYRVSVTATYVDPVDGTLWMGTRSASSIVATPDTTLIAHGERNGGLAQIAGDSTLRVWFLNRSFEPACGEVSCFSIGAPEASSVGHYPFFRGDVVWLADLSPIDPSITLEDPQGLLSGLAPHLQPSRACFSAGCVESSDSILLSSHTTRGLAVQQRPEAVDVWAYWYSSAVRPDVSVFHAASEADAEHNQWYGDDSQNCQIGLPCYGAWGRGPLGDVDRLGDEEGDVKLLFGGAVIKTDTTQHFVPYASMAVIIPAARQREDGTFELLDEKGQRICPRYQGAAGGLGTCDPLLRIDGREVDLFITPTGTRPGSVLEVGDQFVFSGQVWPTLDVAVAITVTSPSGQVRTFSDRASVVGYLDAAGKTFEVTEAGVYTVHITLTQDQIVPSTGLAPDPPLVADGRTTQSVYGYEHPLSAILGSADSTYRFFVAERLDLRIAPTAIFTLNRPPANPVPASVSMTFELPAGMDSVWYSVTTQGFVIEQAAAPGLDGRVQIHLDQRELYERGLTSIVLGAESLIVTVVGQVAGDWKAYSVNLRSMTAFGGTVSIVRVE